MPRNTKKQADRLQTINRQRRKLARRYAFRMRPHILRWEAEGLSQRGIVELLNEAGASVPSEYEELQAVPTGTKTWSLVQYQRFRKLAEEAHERMKWWATRNRKSHVRPYGDGRGLFKRPELAGLDPNVNRSARRTWESAEDLLRPSKAYEEQLKDPSYAARRREADARLIQYWADRDNGVERKRKPKVRVGKLLLPHPDDYAADILENDDGED